MLLNPGVRVAARGLEWDVVNADPPPDQTGLSQQRVRLCCAAGDLVGLEWDILVPLEPIGLLRTEADPRAPGSLRDWLLFHTAWLLDQTPGPAAPAGRMAIEPYQRVPLLRALDMIRPRLLLADGVGLGKTIQAGLIAAELLVRRRAHRILIVTPPGPLLRQWAQEMRLRFGLRFTSLADATSLREARGRLEFGGNPFEANALCLTSIDFAKSDQVLTELERTRWDLVIIDEAHHCAEPDSRRHLLARVLAGLSDGLLLLTATPHDGVDAHFAGLMGLLDPSLVDGSGRLVGSAYRRHVVRRLKAHIRDPRTGLPLFRERRVQPIRVTVDSAIVRDFHQALSDLVLPRLRAPRDKRHLTDALAFVTLLKRSLSTIAACVATLRVVAARRGAVDGPAQRRDRQRALQAWRRRVARYGVLATAEEEAAAAMEAEEMAASLDAGTAFAALIAAGEAAIPHDPKLHALCREIRLIRLDHPGANILVYTEYAESQRAAAAALADIGGPVLTIAGSDTEDERIRTTERFAAEGNIVLLSTDALAEGLNLQRKCFHLIHLDLPYNPNRLEQRNGRIDRYGQTHDPDIRYCYLSGTFEERLLFKLIEKYEAARACLDIMPNTLAVSSASGGLREPVFGGGTGDLFAGLPRLVQSLDLTGEDTASEAWRDLLREIDRAFKAFEDMAVRHGWLSGGQADPPGDSSADAFNVADFVAAALPGGRVPEMWAEDLRDLPGFDGATKTARLTNDPVRLRDDQGRDLLYPGRAHPLTRRVIGRLRSGTTGQVATARGERSVLTTYAAETPDGRFRRVFALRQFPDGRIVAEPDWLRLADAEPRIADWDSGFAAWAGGAALDQAAQDSADRAFADYAAADAARHLRRAAEVAAWLGRRADEICGPAAMRRTGDLFGAVVSGPNEVSPEARLRRCADDPAQPDAMRRAAADVLDSLAAQPANPPAMMRLRRLGLLLLCP
jgi:superfamily II DNA or RNA helicase